MAPDIDSFAAFFWLILLGTAIWGLQSDPLNRRHTRFLLATCPATFAFMAVYANARESDAWCLSWAVAGLFVSGFVASVALARLTAHYVADQIKANRQD